MTARFYQTDLAAGITLSKSEKDYSKNFEVLDQVNTYSVENSLDKVIEVTIDITGSDGAGFVNALDSHSLTKTVTIEPFGSGEVA